MKILFIAPLPPPITGHSLASEILLSELKKNYHVNVINFNKGNLTQGFNSFIRIIQVLKILKNIKKMNNNIDVIYLTITQSIAGNIKDLFIYLISFKKLPKMLIHLHGGGLRQTVFEKNKFLLLLNKFFLRRVGGIVVLGNSLVNIFNNIVPREKIHIVNNFAEDYLFISQEKIKKKFNEINSLNILFLSNLIPGKGYEELLEAYLDMDDYHKTLIKINFAGHFQTQEKKQIFLDKIKQYSNITYHGPVFGERKKELFWNAHIFCLPSYYEFEGQPISILEAYAAGCFVITTDHGGIKDIFQDGKNGILVKKNDYLSIKIAILKILAKKNELVQIALSNRKEAEDKYTQSRYCNDLDKLLLSVIEN